VLDTFFIQVKANFNTPTETVGM